MEDGGNRLMDFIIRAHKFIKNGQIDITEWHKMVKVIFKQMIEFVDYIHNKKICHFDISLENFLINSVDVAVTKISDDGETVEKLEFCKDKVYIKACDFGLADYFDDGDFSTNKYCGKVNYQSPEITANKKSFNAKSNDIFCLGVCLFMMIIGGSPFNSTKICDRRFRQIINGDLIGLLKKWKCLHYVDNDLLILFQSIFKYEDKRCNLSQIQKCRWLNK